MKELKSKFMSMNLRRLTAMGSIFHFPDHFFYFFPVKQTDECGSLAEFSAPALAVQYSFSNFSFKVKPTTPRFFQCR